MLLLPVGNVSGPRMQLMIRNPYDHIVRKLKTGIKLGKQREERHMHVAA